MIFNSGTNQLLLPQVQEYYFSIDNIITNDYSLVSFGFTNQNQSNFILLSGGYVYLQNSGQNTDLYSYNSGSAFSISGWYFQNINGTDNRIYGYVNTVPFQITGLNRSSAQSFTIQNNVPLSCQVSFTSIPINYSLTFPSSFPINTSLNGTLTTNVGSYIYGSGTMYFDNSLQALLSGNPLTGTQFVSPSSPLVLNFYDTDPTAQQDTFNFNLILNTVSGEWNQGFVSTRTGLYNGGTEILTGIDTPSVISGLFNGIWSGNNFVYEDAPQSITQTYFLYNTQNNGLLLGDTLTITLSANTPQNGGNYQASYITGFNLTNSGQYLYPPTALFTGYYSVEGISQSLNSMLFSSGCSGNLNVIFSGLGNWGTGASGSLLTQQVQFQNIYTPGVNTFYLVTGFNILNSGTGYTQNPAIFVLTGQYANCYDVPSVYGYPLSLFNKFNPTPVLNTLAGYLTGQPLLTTGLVSGGATTGYLVTGWSLGNIGFGYNTGNYIPYFSLIRSGNDGLITGLSGAFLLKSSGTLNMANQFSVSVGVAGQDLSPLSSGFSGSLTLNGNQNYFSIEIASSGIDNTSPISVNLAINYSSGNYSQIISDSKFYNTGVFFLNKQTGQTNEVFNTGALLSFALTQNQLNNFYSSSGYVGYGWPIDIGSLNF